MRLIIIQDKEDYRACFRVLDGSGEEKYRVTGERNQKGATLCVQDRQSVVMAMLRQRNFLFLSGYSISVSGNNCASVIQNLYSMRTLLRVRGADWSLRGDLRLRSFDVLDENHSVVMSHAKRWGVWGDGYELNIFRPECELLCLCIALCIDYAVPLEEGSVVAINS